MEFDHYRQGFIVFTDAHALMTSDGTTTHLIARNSTQGGYREGVGADARFGYITGFAQISEKLVVVADTKNHCMRLTDRTTNKTSAFSGQCESHGYKDGRPSRFHRPHSVVIDTRGKYQLLITDHWNAAVRTVDVMSQAVSTFVKDDTLDDIRGITQEEKSGDLYVTVASVVFRITYTQRTVSLISGSPGTDGYRDSALLDSLFYWPHELILIAPHILLVVDGSNDKLRLLDMKSDKVTTLNVTNSPNYPTSLLLTNNSLYVGQWRKIVQYKCEYYNHHLYSFTTITFRTRQRV